MIFTDGHLYGPLAGINWYHSIRKEFAASCCNSAMSINQHDLVVLNNTGIHRNHNPKVEGSNPSTATDICNCLGT